MHFFCIYVCLYTTCVLGALRDQEKPSDSLELESQTVVSCHVGLGNWTWVLWKNIQQFRHLNHLSSPQLWLCYKRFCFQISVEISIFKQFLWRNQPVASFWRLAGSSSQRLVGRVAVCCELTWSHLMRFHVSLSTVLFITQVSLVVEHLERSHCRSGFWEFSRFSQFLLRESHICHILRAWWDHMILTGAWARDPLLEVW